MARILYGVMGDARGHINRALIVANEMPDHEFLFVGGGQVRGVRKAGYEVVEVPIPGTSYRNNQVDVPATVFNALKVFAGSRSVVRRLAKTIEDFNPDLILTDYEYFTPLAARKLGRSCVSIDHQHILTHCLYEPPAGQAINRFMTRFAVGRLFSSAATFLVISFFRLPPKDPSTTEVLPPLIRKEVREHNAGEGDHVLVYQTSPTFHRLFPVLEDMKSRFIIYGFGERPPSKNVVFKAPSNHGFLEDLAKSRYCIVNGGHNAISEALFYGKPVFCFPIANAYEQFMNAHFLDRLGFGSFSLSPQPNPRLLENFEKRLSHFRQNVGRETFYGNDAVRKHLEELISCRPS
jgi:uncharacterized protein (TIGR00661 family)